LVGSGSARKIALVAEADNGSAIVVVSADDGTAPFPALRRRAAPGRVCSVGQRDLLT
jgi:hypothetical protein